MQPHSGTSANVSHCAALADTVRIAVRPQGDRASELDADVSERIRGEVRRLRARYPRPGYTAELTGA